MIRKRLISFVFVACLLLQVSYARDFKALDAYIESARADWEIPGVAVAIVEDDRVVYSKGFGHLSVNSKKPVDGDTIFNIASNTKAFTATSLGILVQEGKLSWDSKVNDIMPEFELYDPEVTRKVTVRDLLCHRCGLGLWSGDLTWWYSNYDRDEVIRRIRYQEPVSEFRTSYIYTNLMFLVAGELIPDITGSSWDNFVETRLFKPLDMNRSVTSAKELVNLKNVAIPHATFDGKMVAINHLNVDNCAPAGAINSCVNDLSKWVRLQLKDGEFNNKQIVRADIIKETRKPHNLIVLSDSFKSINPDSHLSAYGLGLRVLDYRGRLLVNHGGELDGMSSYVGFMPEEQIGVIVLTNKEDHQLQQALPLYLFDYMMGSPKKDWHKIYFDRFCENKKKNEDKQKERLANKPKDTKPTLAISDYAGNYTSKVYGKAVVTCEGGVLKVKLSAHPEFEGVMEHYYYDTFQATWSHKPWKKSLVYFRFNGHGEITKFLMSVRPDWMDTYEYAFMKE